MPRSPLRLWLHIACCRTCWALAREGGVTWWQLATEPDFDPPTRAGW